MTISQLHHLHALCDEVLLGSGNPRRLTRKIRSIRTAAINKGRFDGEGNVFINRADWTPQDAAQAQRTHKWAQSKKRWAKDGGYGSRLKPEDDLG